MNNKPEPKFVPGERVVVLNAESKPHLVGQTIVLTDLKLVQLWKDGSPSGFGYKSKEIIALDGCSWKECQLGKLPPNTPTTFADCIFKPEKATA